MLSSLMSDQAGAALIPMFANVSLFSGSINGLAPTIITTPSLGEINCSPLFNPIAIGSPFFIGMKLSSRLLK